MKQLNLFVLMIGFITVQSVAQNKSKTKVEEQTKVCENLAQADKPVIAIMPFKVSSAEAAQTIGDGVSDMLMNAVFGSGCFRVVERERLHDIMSEQGLGLSGAGNESSFAQVGKMAGANVLVFGTITEFKENESGGGGGGAGLLGRGLKGIIGGVGARTSHLGYTLRFINPSTGELIDMKSFDKKRTSVGLAAGGLFGRGLAGGTFYKSKSMQDALEESLIDAVNYMSENKTVYAGVISDSKNAASASAPQMTRDGCALLKISHRPKFMVIIPEEHLAGRGSNYDPNRVDININGGNSNNNDQRPGGAYQSGGASGEKTSMENGGREGINTARSLFRPPDPAGETEIMKRFLEYGFELVDSKQFEKLRSDKDFQNAFENPGVAQKIAAKFGADIIIVGEAFSEYSKAQNGMSSCRARVEVKAIMTSNARILVAEGLHGSGMDVSEVIAGKTALRQAGGKVADYFLAQLCTKADDISALMGPSKGGSKSSAVASENTSELQFKNIDFNKAMAVNKMLQSIPGVSKSERISFENNVARFKVSHKGDTNKLIEKVATTKSLMKLKVLSISGNTADVEVIN